VQNKFNIQLIGDTTMNLKSFILCAGLALTLGFTSAASQAETRGGAGVLFTIENAAGGNPLVAFPPAADGSVSFFGAFATDGIGTGGGLGNQGALVLSRGGRWLFACNAGSDEVSVFRV